MVIKMSFLVIPESFYYRKYQNLISTYQLVETDQFWALGKKGRKSFKWCLFELFQNTFLD